MARTGPLSYPETGQRSCYDAAGNRIPCDGSGQDGEHRKGVPWPEPRFEPRGDEVLDRLTGLSWLKDANPAGFPIDWREAFGHIAAMNRERAASRDDWRLPNRRELRSLMDYGEARPALPAGHPFRNIMQGWYWTSTTAAINTAYAWYVHLEGARMFYGGKQQFYMLWPVRGRGNGLLPATGQRSCFSPDGSPTGCAGSGQDGELRYGRAWPVRRFETRGEAVIDHLTGLEWSRRADLADGSVTWQDALETAAALNRPDRPGDSEPWRLPNINELETLVDSDAFAPALPAGHPFADVRKAYWSSTTSAFETDWAWALYLEKGACGVGRKDGPYFSVWAVRDHAGPPFRGAV